MEKFEMEVSDGTQIGEKKDREIPIQKHKRKKYRERHTGKDRRNIEGTKNTSINEMVTLTSTAC